MPHFRDIADSDANEFRPLLPQEMDCVLTVQDFVEGKFNVDRASCQVLTDRSTLSIVVRGRFVERNTPFEARLCQDKTITIKM